MNCKKTKEKYLSMAFADKLKNFRESANISQSALAKKIKINQSRIAIIELGAEPYASELIVFSKLLNEPITKLLDISVVVDNQSLLCEFPDKTDEELKKEIIKSCKLVQKILLSNNSVAKDALRTNLVAFEDHNRLLTAESRMDNLERELKYLKELYNLKIVSGT
jgi:transcriptional regulator with XRE-family HTH domain